MGKALSMPLLALYITFVGFWFDVAGVFRSAVLAALWHELGHLTAYCRLRGEVPPVRITPAGFAIVVGPADLSAGHEAIVAAAGPLFNLFAGGLFYVFGRLNATYTAYILACVHLFLAALNLLPLPFMDGGRILALLAAASSRPRLWRRAAFVCTAIVLPGLCAAVFMQDTALAAKASAAAVCIYGLWKSLRLAA